LQFNLHPLLEITKLARQLQVHIPPCDGIVSNLRDFEIINIDVAGYNAMMLGSLMILGSKWPMIGGVTKSNFVDRS
jgi:hypothetical protein